MLMHKNPKLREKYLLARESELLACNWELPPLHLDIISELKPELSGSGVLDLWISCRHLEELVEGGNGTDGDVRAAAAAVATIIGYHIEEDPFVEGSSIIITSPSRKAGVFVDLPALGNVIHTEKDVGGYFWAEMMDRWCNTSWPSPLGFARSLRKWPGGMDIVRRVWGEISDGRPPPWRPEGREWEEAKESGYVE